MKKVIIKGVLMVCIMVGISNYLMYIMTGKAPFSPSNFNLSSIGFSAPKLDVPSLPASKESAFKWVDSNGVVHYSSEAPPEGQAAELIEVDPNTNLVQATKLPDPEIDNERAEQPDSTNMPTGNIYNPDTIKQLIDDAKGVQETLNQRYEDIEKQ